MCGAMMAATPGKNLRPPGPNWSDKYASRKSQGCRQHMPKRINLF